jgi:hypothetical protein
MKSRAGSVEISADPPRGFSTVLALVQSLQDETCTADEVVERTFGS